MPVVGPMEGTLSRNRFNLKPKVEAPGASRRQEVPNTTDRTFKKTMSEGSRFLPFWMSLGIDPQVMADQMGHGVNVNQHQYTRSLLKRRANALNVIEKTFRRCLWSFRTPGKIRDPVFVKLRLPHRQSRWMSHWIRATHNWFISDALSLAAHL